MIARVLAWAGAALLAAAEVGPLLHVRTFAVHPRLEHTVRGGPHHGRALPVIAVLAALLSLRAGRPGGRPVAALALTGPGDRGGRPGFCDGNACLNRQKTRGLPTARDRGLR